MSRGLPARPGSFACIPFFAVGFLLIVPGCVAPPKNRMPATEAVAPRPPEQPIATAGIAEDFRIEITSNEAERLATAPLHSAGLPATAGIHDLLRNVIATADLSLAIRRLRIRTDGNSYDVRFHALMAGEDGLIPPLIHSPRLQVDGESVLVGAGPLTVWSDDRLVLYTFTLGPWALVPGAGDRPLLLLEPEEIGRRTIALTVFGASRTGHMRDLAIYRTAWLSAVSDDQRFRLRRRESANGGLPAFDVETSPGQADAWADWGKLHFDPQIDGYVALAEGSGTADDTSPDDSTRPVGEPADGSVSTEWPYDPITP